MDKFKSILTVVLTSVLVFGLSAAFLLLPDNAVSGTERRKLKQLPVLSSKTVFSGEFIKDMEAYMLDQFPARDIFRSVNAITRFNIMAQKDVNGLYTVNGGLYKREYPLNTAQIHYAADNMNRIYNDYLTGMNVFYSVIPDKNAFEASENGYLSIDYTKMMSLFCDRVENMDYIDIWDCLTVDDYYRTDTHWRQERLFPAAWRLSEALKVEITLESGYTRTIHSPFYGVYYGQSAMPAKPDELVYLTNDIIDNTVVWSAETNNTYSVYDTDKLYGMDAYDVFLSGAQALLTIDTGGAGRELVIFRDSYGSSIAPLFLGAYSKITLIDLRYINSALLGEFITFEDQDVLFLYSTGLINNGMLLK